MDNKEVFMKLYELNQKYHDTKEKRAWIAVSFYALFSAAIFSLSSGNDNPCSVCAVIAILLTVIFVCVGIFVWFQYRQKRVSVEYEKELEKILSKRIANTDKELRDYFSTVNRINNKGVQREKFDRLVESAIGLLLFALYIIQIVAIAT